MAGAGVKVRKGDCWRRLEELAGTVEVVWETEADGEGWGGQGGHVQGHTVSWCYTDSR